MSNIYYIAFSLIAVIIIHLLIVKLPKGGPIVRKDSMQFSVTSNEMIQYITKMLELSQTLAPKEYRYTDIVKSQNGLLIELTVIPSLPMAGLPHMKIQIKPCDNECIVNISIHSKKSKIGETFGYSEQIIKDFFYSIKWLIKKAEHAATQDPGGFLA